MTDVYRPRDGEPVPLTSLRTLAILRECGYDDEQIDSHLASGFVATSKSGEGWGSR